MHAQEKQLKIAILNVPSYVLLIDRQKRSLPGAALRYFQGQGLGML